MDEERCVSGYVSLPEEAINGTLPCGPRIGGNSVGGRADGEQIQHHVLGVAVPPPFEKSSLRFPAVRQRVSAVQHPVEINATINVIGGFPDAIVGKVFATGDHS